MPKELNPIAWFGTRELHTVPRHFVRAPSPKSDESHQWVLTKLQGRFSISADSTPNTLLDFAQYFYFEDSAEAMMYELRWSGHSGNNSLF